MRVLLRKYLKKYLSDDVSARLKKAEYRSRKLLVNLLPPITEQNLRRILTDRLRLQSGDNLFVHGSASMTNTLMSAEEVVNILRSIIGEKAIICVPTFCPMASEKYLEINEPFNMLSDRSGMGKISEYVRTHSRSVRSNHPTKSIAGIGEGVEQLVVGHEDSKYSFDRNSPYFKMLGKNFKIIGLGAQMSYLSFVHVAEDCNRNEFPVDVYLRQEFKKTIVMPGGAGVEKGYFAHDLGVVSKANPEKFVRRNLNANDYEIYSHFLTPYFAVKADELYHSVLKNSKQETIYY